jgi:hypothetical protein
MENPENHSKEWMNAAELLLVWGAAARTLLVDASVSRVRFVRSRVIHVVNCLYCLGRSSLSISESKSDDSDLGEELPEAQRYDLSSLSLWIEEACSCPLNEPEAVYLELSAFLGKFKDSAKLLKNLCIGMQPDMENSEDSSSEDEMTIGTNHAVEYAVVHGSKMLCKLCVTITEDLCIFVKDQYEYDQNLCWNCYSTSWLVGILRIVQGISEQIEELISYVNPMQNPEHVLPCVRFLKVHIKALLDIANGHDQFQESEISSSKEVFKSGHHWSYKMNRRLHTAFDSISIHLYRLGVR